MDKGYEQLKRNSEELSSINHQQEKRVNDWEKKTLHLTTAYIFLQVIILNGISGRSSMHCSQWWVPFTLSLLCSLVYGITFSHVVSKYVRAWYHLDLNRIEHEMIIRDLHLASNSKVTSQEPTTRPRELKPDSVAWARRYISIFIIVCALLAFAVVMLYACRAFLCG